MSASLQPLPRTAGVVGGRGFACAIAVALLISATPAFGQGQPPAPSAPPAQAPEQTRPAIKAWTQAFSGGLAITSGNKDTSTLNLGYELIYDPKKRNLVKSDGLFLRGKTAGDLSSERLGLNARDEYRLREDGAFVFGQMQFVRDRFKQINYLIAPTTGLGYRIIDTPETRMSLDGGLGGVWEKNPGADVKTSGALTIQEKLSQRISTTTTLTQSLSALYKTADFSDSLYVFGATVSASVTTRVHLKVEVLDSYKNKTRLAGVVNNDLALVVAIVYRH